MNAKLKRQLDECRVPNYTHPFEFDYSGRGYWIVKGPVPLEVAQEIYKDPAGKYIRVEGHCLSPAPEEPWITLRMPDGTELLTMNDKKVLSLTDYINPEFSAEYIKKFTFSDNSKIREQAKYYVDLYHIDNVLGLRVFVDYLRLYNLLPK